MTVFEGFLPGDGEIMNRGLGDDPLAEYSHLDSSLALKQRLGFSWIFSLKFCVSKLSLKKLFIILKNSKKKIEGKKESMPSA